MNKERGPHRCCCDKGPCPVPDFGSGSSWGLCCDRHVLHRWDLCAALGTPGAEGAPDCADYCRSHESLEKSRRNKRRDEKRIRRERTNEGEPGGTDEFNGNKWRKNGLQFEAKKAKKVEIEGVREKLKNTWYRGENKQRRIAEFGYSKQVQREKI